MAKLVTQAKREYGGIIKPTASETKRRMSREIAFKTAAFLAKGGEIQHIERGVSGAKPFKRKINPSRNWAQGGAKAKTKTV